MKFWPDNEQIKIQFFDKTTNLKVFVHEIADNTISVLSFIKNKIETHSTFNIFASRDILTDFETTL
jgi:hypothetical protein